MKILKYILRFLISLLILIPLWILMFDYLILPTYVGTDNNIFLPDCRDDYQHIATKKLSDLELDVKIINLPFTLENKPGTVVKMHPKSFTKVKKGRLIVLSIAGHKKNILLPDLRNLSIRNAKIKISELGLNLDTLMYEFNPEIKNGYVSFQIPTNGTVLKSGSNITLGVSKGTPPDYFIIPDLINSTLNKAKAEIRKDGLRVGEIEYIYKPNLINNTVIDQSYPAGLKVAIPVKINLTISRDYYEN